MPLVNRGGRGVEAEAFSVPAGNILERVMTVSVYRQGGKTKLYSLQCSGILNPVENGFWRLVDTTHVGWRSTIDIQTPVYPA